MRRVFLAFAVLGSFFACANSDDPQPAANNTPVDAAADAKKKDTGTTATGDTGVEDKDSGEEEDADTETDADTTDADTDSSSSTDASVTDTSVTDTSVADTATNDTGTTNDSGLCNDLVYGGSAITITNTTAAAPAATGGTIADGTYQLTGYKAYSAASNGAGVLSLQAVVRIKNNQIDALQKLNGTEVRKSGTFVVSGSDIDITWSCINGFATSPEAGKYTATTNTFVYYLDAFPNNETEFTK